MTLLSSEFFPSMADISPASDMRQVSCFFSSPSASVFGTPRGGKTESTFSMTRTSPLGTVATRFANLASLSLEDHQVSDDR